jgi:hypothetical protein
MYIKNDQMNNCDFLGHFQLAPPALFAPTHRKMFVTNLLADFSMSHMSRDSKKISG